MSNLFFDGVLDFIGRRIKYEALANYAGNSYCKDSYKIIEENYPLKTAGKAESNSSISQLFKGIQITKIKKTDKDSLPDWMKKNKEDAKASKEEINVSEESE